MRALELQAVGDPPVLAVVDLPVPTLGEREALVRVAACGFCHHDRSVMAGLLRRGVAPGVVLGHEISGVVEDVGSQVTMVRPGDRVVSLLTDACGECDRCQSGREHRCRRGLGIGHGRNGGFAEYVAVSQHSLAPIPEGVDLLPGCLLACPVGVSLEAVEGAAGIGPGQTVVVTGAGGGLGIHAVQAAAGLGARVLAVTSSPEKAAQLPAYGAAEVLEAGALDFAELVMALTGDEGAEVVIDTVGSALFPSTLRSVAQFGTLVLLGEVAGGRVPVNLAELIFRDVRVVGASGVGRAMVEKAGSMYAAGQLSPVLQEVLGLEDAPQAYRLMSERGIFGRVALRP